MSNKPIGHIDALAIRKRLGRTSWMVPEPYGPDGFVFKSIDTDHVIIVTYGHAASVEPWIHASIGLPNRMPTYYDLITMHKGVFGPDAYAYQVFAPDADHVNIHEFVLHLWGRPDGTAALPNFGIHGSI